MRNAKEIKQKLENYLKDYELKLEAWNQVKRKTKKDGLDFTVFSKNFENAFIGHYTIVEDNDHPYLTIYYDFYKSDHLEIYVYLDTLSDDDPRKQNYKPQFVRQTYKYNIDECFEAIEKYKLLLIKRINEYKQQLSLFDEYIEKANNIIEQINDLLKDKNLHDELSYNSLGYAIRDYIYDK